MGTRLPGRISYESQPQIKIVVADVLNLVAGARLEILQGEAKTLSRHVSMMIWSMMGL